MAGTIPLSLTQQFDQYGEPLDGGLLYIIQAGTVATPQNAYQDLNLTIPLPNPIPLDAAGRIPQFFLADGYIKVRLQDQHGVVQLSADNILVIGPSGGGGGGAGSIDPTAVLSTGDIKVRYDDAILPNFVRANGKTIGSATSGATELADPSAQALFLHLWQKDPTLPVYNTSGAVVGRGASAAADWGVNNRNIGLPDFRGRNIAALATMGNSDVGLFSGVTFTKGSQTVLGSQLGALRHTLSAGEIPTITSRNATHGIAVSGTVQSAADGGFVFTNGVLANGNPAGGGVPPNQAPYTASGSFSKVNSIVVNSSGLNDINVTSNNTSGLAHDIANPSILITVYLRL
jgi:hypothetical protein